MATGADAYLTRMIQREISRRYVDSSRMDIYCTHGVAYMRGVMSKLQTHPEVDLSQEAETIKKTLRQRMGIRDVIWEVITENK